MAVKNQGALLIRLRKQVRLLERKAEHSQNKLRAALVKVKRVAKAFNSRLALKEKAVKAKIAAARAEVYHKVAVDVARQLKKKAAAKEKAVRSTVAKVEKFIENEFKLKIVQNDTGKSTILPQEDGIEVLTVTEAITKSRNIPNLLRLIEIRNYLYALDEIKALLEPEDEIEEIEEALQETLRIAKDESERKEIEAEIAEASKATRVLTQEEISTGVSPDGMSADDLGMMTRLGYLYNKKNQKPIPISENSEKEADSQSRFKKLFDPGKKLIDLVDDLMQAGKSALESVIPPKIFDPMLHAIIGSCNFIIHLAEGWEGIKVAREAYRHANIGQQKTRIATGVATFAAAGVGAGLSLALIASAAGASVVGAPLMVVIIPALLTGIYAMGLWRTSYILHKAREHEAKALSHYEKSVDALHDYKKTEGEKLATARYNIIKFYQPILDKVNNQKKLTPTEAKYYQQYLEKMELANKDNQTFHQDYEKLKLNLLINLQRYQECRAHRLKAERDVAFNALEVAGSALVLTGITLGAAAVIGALSVASFGIVPLVLLMVGVTVGFATKKLEAMDEKSNHALTATLRQQFIDLGKKIKYLFTPTPEEKLIKVIENSKRNSPAFIRERSSSHLSSRSSNSNLNFHHDQNLDPSQTKISKITSFFSRNKPRRSDRKPDLSETHSRRNGRGH